MIMAKIITAIVATFGGLGLLVYGIGGAVGAYDTSSNAGFILGGAVVLLVGMSLVRQLSGDPEASSHIPRIADPEDMLQTTSPIDMGEESNPHTDEVEHEYGSQPTVGQDTPTLGQGTATPRSPQAAGVRRFIVYAVLAAVLFGGAGRQIIEGFVDGFSDDSAPNIPVHILDACNEAFAEQEGPAASFGQPYEYVQRFDGDEEISFRTAQGSEWDCRWSPTNATAVITATRQAE